MSTRLVKDVLDQLSGIQRDFLISALRDYAEACPYPDSTTLPFFTINYAIACCDKAVEIALPSSQEILKSVIGILEGQ